MKKLRTMVKNIPRKCRITADLFLLILLLFLFYLSIGAPAFTTEQAFRRAEKINMVGPGEIVDTLGWSDYPMFETLIVAETEEGVVFFAEYPMGDSDAWPKSLNIEYPTPLFSYRKKTGDITILGAPVGMFGIADSGYVDAYPIYVFDDYPEALRAELEITITGISQDSTDVYRLQSEADRTGDGFFRFILDPGGSKAADFISHVSNGDFWFRSLTDSERDARIPVTLRLYDEDDTLIVEKELFIQSPAVQAHDEQNDPLT